MQGTGIIKGTVYLTIAQVIFVFVGYVIHVGLGRILGPADYGTYAVVISLLTVANLLLTTGVPQAVSKFISENASKKSVVLSKAFKLQLISSICVFFIYFFLAKKIALLLKDENLTNYIRISSFAIPFYALYALIVGYFNGLREYRKQAFNQIVYFIAKPILIFSLVFIGFNTFGAVTGFALSPIVGLVAGVLLIHSDFDGGVFSLKKIVHFATPFTIFSVATSLILSLDLFSVKALLPGSSQASGFYSAASMIARVICYLPGALSTALFPAISDSTYNLDVERTKRYITKSFKLLVLFLFPVASIMAASSKQLVTALYSSSFLPASIPLKILSFGMAIYALFNLFLIIISGTGKPKTAMYHSLLVLFAAFFLNIFLVPKFQLVGAAWATTLASMIGVTISGVYILHHFVTAKKAIQ